MHPEYNKLLAWSKRNKKQIKQAFKEIGKWKPKQQDEWFEASHEEAFEKIDCLQCANCCKTTSPIFRDKDVVRLAKHVGLKPGKFIEEYLHLDDEQDYVLNTAPCPFLGADNYCTVYEARPNACREYPHTDRKKMKQILKLTEQNTQVCPAVVSIVQKITVNCK